MDEYTLNIKDTDSVIVVGSKGVRALVSADPSVGVNSGIVMLLSLLLSDGDPDLLHLLAQKTEQYSPEDMTFSPFGKQGNA